MAKRLKVSVRWDIAAMSWAIFSGKSEFEGWSDTKAQAVARAREIAKADPPSQLVVFNKNGRIGYEHTYGADPKRFPG